MKIREHEYRQGSAFCIHCGAVAADMSCNERKVVGEDRARPASVVDDFDAIGKRLAELRNEKAQQAEAAAMAPAPPPPLYDPAKQPVTALAGRHLSSREAR